MRERRPLHRARRGFTLIEILFSVTILGLVLGAVGAFHLRGQESARATARQAEVQGRADRALQRVAHELVSVGGQWLQPNPTTQFGSPTLTYQSPAAVAADGSVTPGAPRQLALALDVGEADNGADDDGDGLIDERRLLLTRDLGTADQNTITLCHGVAEWLEGELPNLVDDNGNGVINEAGFNVRRIGDLLELRLTIEGADRGGAIVRWTSETAVVVHN